MTLRLFLAACLAATCGLALRGAPTSGSFSGVTPFGWAYPVLASDDAGNSYLLLKESSSRIEFWKFDGTTWTSLPAITTAATGDSGFSDDLGVAVDHLGNVHAVFRHYRGSGVTSTRGVKYGYYNGTSWSFQLLEEASCSSGCRNYNDPHIVVDRTGGAHVTYEFRESAT
ncbi:MAG: hypothetical protein ACLFR7_12525, partial [Opitutales bacterium]